MLRTAFTGLAIASALLLGACGKGGAAGSGSADGGKAVSVAFGLQNGVAYIPLHVMQAQGLVEKHAKALGITVIADYKNLGQAAFVRDGLLSNQLQFGVAGPPTLVTMHEKTGGDIMALGAVVSVPSWVNTTNPKIRSVCDFGPADKIAVPTVKSSVQAVTLQMMTDQACHDPFKADPFTVSMPHPDGYNALMTGMVDTHFTTPPFATEEVAKGKGRVRTIASSYDVLGGKGTLVFLIGSDKWRKANPKAYQAVSEAFEEAEAFTREHPREAAQIYLQIEKPKFTLDEALAQMTMPDVVYGTTPVALGRYSTFMRKIGTVKGDYDWKALSMPELRDRPGS